MTFVEEYQRYVHQWPAIESMPRKYGLQPGMWSCIIPGLPVHLVRELKLGTVDLQPH